MSTAQEGAVIDATVVASRSTTHHIRRSVIHAALQTLTRARTVPKERGAWTAWLRKRNEATEAE